MSKIILFNLFQLINSRSNWKIINSHHLLNNKWWNHFKDLVLIFFYAKIIFFHLKILFCLIFTDSSAFITIPESVSYIESFVSVRSVTQKMTYVSSQGYSYILLENGEYSLTSSNVYVYKRIPYVIYYLSPTYIKTGIFLEMNVRKKHSWIY